MGLEGYCPVTLFKSVEWVKGSPDHSVTFDGCVYSFANVRRMQRMDINFVMAISQPRLHSVATAAVNATCSASIFIVAATVILTGSDCGSMRSRIALRLTRSGLTYFSE